MRAIISVLVVLCTCILLIYIAIGVSAAQDVEMNSTLNEGVAHNNQEIFFTCLVRGSNILEWNSAEYIGQGGFPLQVLSYAGTDTNVSSTTRPSTYAVRRSVTRENDRLVIVSDLRIIASTEYPVATVTCSALSSKKITFQTLMSSAQREVSLNSTLHLGEYARPGERVTFTCEARDTFIMEWYSEEYIGTGEDRIEILGSGDGNNQTRYGGNTVATTVSVNTYSGVTVIVSQLHIITSEQIPTSSVTCAINGPGPRQTISFTTTAVPLREVTLNSTLHLGEYARPRQRVTFTCKARDTSVLEWYSDEYIGTGGDVIEILRNGDGSNQTRRGGETVATTVSVNTYSGVTVIVSQLHLITSEQFPTSSVMCAISGNGPRETISFTTTAVSLQAVILSSTLHLGEYARPRQRVTFTCKARDTSVLEWHSDEYIGTGGDVIEILRSGDGSNQTRRGGETVATTVSVNTYSGVTVIISQLHIMTSELIPTSSVTCAINGNGPQQTISFTTTDSIPEITTTITTPDNQFHTTAERDSNNSNIPVIAGLCGVVVIITAVSLGVVVTIMYARTKGRCKLSVGSDEMELSALPEKVANEKPDDIESPKKAAKEPLLIGMSRSTSLPSISGDKLTFIVSSPKKKLAGVVYPA